MRFETGLALSGAIILPHHQHNTHIPDGLDALKALAKDATTCDGAPF